MRTLFVCACAALAFAGAGFAGLYFWPIGKPVALSSAPGDPQRGAYLARMAGCIACHSDFASGGKPLAGGHKLPTDFGTFYTPNLTTDRKSGIGVWTVEDFARAVRQGVSPQGEPYYPAFPYPFYAKFSDQDVADLWAAFQTVPPVEEPSRTHDMVPPFNIRSGLKIWRSLFLDPQPFQPDPARSDLWNRGKFLVEGPTHCGACHTPRNLLGARQAELYLHGADKLPDGGKAPPITSVSLKKNGWTVSSLSFALQTGVMPDGDVFGGSMGDVVRDGTAFLSEEDRNAIATYLLENGG